MQPRVSFEPATSSTPPSPRRRSVNASPTSAVLQLQQQEEQQTHLARFLIADSSFERWTVPAWLKCIYQTFFAPGMNATDSYSVKMTKMVLLSLPFLLVPWVAWTARIIHVVFTERRSEPVFHVVAAVHVCFVLLIGIPVAVYVRVSKRAPPLAVHATLGGSLALAITTLLTFPQFPIWVTAYGLALVSVIAFAETPIWAVVYASINAVVAASARSNALAARDRVDTTASSSSNSSANASVSANETVAGPSQFFVGFESYFESSVVERFLFIFLALGSFFVVYFLIFFVAAQLGEVRRELQANAAAGQSMAAALRRFDLQRLESALEQYRALPYRDDMMLEHLASMSSEFSMLGRFSPREVMEGLRREGDRPGDVLLEERAAVCVLVCELCNVSRLLDVVAESRGTAWDRDDALGVFLCDLAARVEQIAGAHGGIVMRVDGAQFRIVWGAPLRLHQRHSGVLACCAALQLVHALKAEFVPMARKKLGIANLRFRIGIHRGPAIVGHIGTFADQDDAGDFAILNNSKSNGRSADPRSAAFFPRTEYNVLAGSEAVRVASVLAVMGMNSATSSIMITRDVLVDEIGLNDVVQAADLVSFAARETMLFAHDARPGKIFCGLQLVGIAADPQRAEHDLVREATRRYKLSPAEEAALLEENDAESGSDSDGWHRGGGSRSGSLSRSSSSSTRSRRNDHGSATTGAAAAASSSSSGKRRSALATQNAQMLAAPLLRHRRRVEAHRAKHAWEASSSSNNSSTSLSPATTAVVPLDTALSFSVESSTDDDGDSSKSSSSSAPPKLPPNDGDDDHHVNNAAGSASRSGLQGSSRESSSVSSAGSSGSAERLRLADMMVDVPSSAPRASGAAFEASSTQMGESSLSKISLNGAAQQQQQQQQKEAGAEVPSASRMEELLRQLDREQTELHRGMIRASVDAVLRPHFAVDEAGIETLHAVGVCQRLFFAGRFRDAARIASQVLLRPVQVSADAAAAAAATAAGGGGRRSRGKHQPQQHPGIVKWDEPVAMFSCKQTQELLVSMAELDKQTIGQFINRCVQTGNSRSAAHGGWSPVLSLTEDQLCSA